ncbi:hypothetical protein [Nocardia huaxiensis]|uniref:hypothetical protein n=1 Tax=Nocardia huaxiensis TaxID=2755382 RepID=UPI001E48F8D5|nr:hypothetical protein [Nocardia huaxiensis]UFS95059.1 hypothetical protein LPY97_30785 [Nocardia huaxiensis]
MSMERGLEEVARKARAVQEAIEQVRGYATVPGVRIEVTADGRITGLDIGHPQLAEAIAAAHARALRHASDQAADLRRELADDPTVALLTRRLLTEETAPPPVSEPAPAAPRKPEPYDEFDDPDYENPYALPPDVQRRYGIR